MDTKPIINRVAQSGIITINLDELLPKKTVAEFDLKNFLFMELILKEKDFRASLKEHDWSQYKEKTLLIYCSADAIIPVWAYMLVASYATPFADAIFHGDKAHFETNAILNTIENLDQKEYEDKRVVVKGCGDKYVSPAAYTAITQKLRPVVKSLMFGEPCSTVPIFKK